MMLADIRQRTLTRTRLALLLFAVLITVAIAGQTWWAVDQDRQQTLTSETTNSLIAVRLLEEHASQTLRDAAHTLDRVARTVQASPQSNDSSFIRSTVSQYDIGHSSHLKALQYVSPEGLSWITSPDYPAHAALASERDHIQFLLRHPAHRGAIVGRPYASAYDSQWVIPVARALFNQAKQPVGVVSVDIRLPYFGALYSRVAKENNASVTLISDEGFILARSPFEARYVDRNISDSSQLALLRKSAAEGSFSDDSFVDDDEGSKLYTYRKLADFPITVVYTRDFAAVLAPWEQRTFERILLSVLTIALIAALIFFLRANIRRLQGTQTSLRESEAKFMGLFQQSPTPSVLARRSDGLFIEVNDAWLRQFGYVRSEVVGRTSRELNLWVNPEERAVMIEALAEHESVDGMEIQHRHRDGHVITGLTFVRHFQSGSEKLLIYALLDITRQREIEQEVRDINQQLERRVQARTEKLEIANRELNTALASLQTMQSELVRSEKMAALGSLVAGIAHELNTPIGNCVTVGSTLQEQAQELTQCFQRGDMRRSMMQTFIENFIWGTDILMSSLTRASELIGSFKRVAVDQSSDQRRTFDLQKTLQGVCLTLEPMFKNTPFTLSTDVEADIAMDSYPGGLGQLVTNFISNALQHGFEGRDRGQMTLRASMSGPGQVTLHFIDDGVGMTEDTRKRVFDPFFTTKLGQGGSGLGMNIAYNIVHDVLGGSIEVQSAAGQGTRIMVVLPCVAPQSMAATGESDLHPQGA
jgi:PAS domain S-box-containing protein